MLEVGATEPSLFLDLGDAADTSPRPSLTYRSGALIAEPAPRRADTFPALQTRHGTLSTWGVEATDPLPDDAERVTSNVELVRTLA